jgi:hypothetical protein
MVLWMFFDMSARMKRKKIQHVLILLQNIQEVFKFVYDFI